MFVNSTCERSRISAQTSTRYMITLFALRINYLDDGFFLRRDRLFHVLLQPPQHHRFQQQLQFLHLDVRFQRAELLQKRFAAVKLTRFQEIQQRKQFADVVLQRRAGQKQSMLLKYEIFHHFSAQTHGSLSLSRP